MAAASRMPYLRYERQLEERASAEASYFNSIDFCRGEFVWSFGDDDEMDADALVRLMPVLGKADFYLINMRILSEGKHHHYILTSAANIQYRATSDLFRDLGVVSATTTLSCLCVRRSQVRESVWGRYLGLSLIYSHSCALLALFHGKPAMFVGEPILTYKMNTVSDEFSRISEVMLARGKSPYAPWTTDLVGMLMELSRETGLSVAEIAGFEEIEFSKTDHRAKHTLLWCFILFHLTQQFIIADQPEPLWLSADEFEFMLEFFRQAGDEAEALFRELHAAVSWVGHTRNRSAHVQELVIRLRRKLEVVEARHFEERVTAPPPPTPAYIFEKGVAFKFARSVPFSVPAGRPYLTILIPTYKRAAKLDALLARLANDGIGLASDVEIVVAINPSGDESYKKALARQDDLPNLRCIRHDTYVGSAEENINRSIGLAAGEFVWLLGDDDVVESQTFWLLRSIVASGEVDVCIANYRVESDPEASSITGFITSDLPLSEVDYPHWVAECGLTTSAAFISIYCFRKGLFKSFGGLIAAAPIYSHVFAFLQMFVGARIKFLGYRLVTRRISPQAEAGFAQFANERGASFFEPWTVGLLSLVDSTVKAGVIDARFFASVVERGHLSVEYDLQGEIANQFCRQIMRYIRTGNREELPAIAAIERFIAYSDGVPRTAGLKILENRKALSPNLVIKRGIIGTIARITGRSPIERRFRALQTLIDQISLEVSRPNKWSNTQATAERDQKPGQSAK
jgi:glycosyltransferase involved in cell wall biosynthesis